MVAKIQPFDGRWHVQVNVHGQAHEQRQAIARDEVQARRWVARWLARDRERILRELGAA